MSRGLAAVSPGFLLVVAATLGVACGGSQTSGRPRGAAGAADGDVAVAALPSRAPNVQPYPATREFALRLAQHRDLTSAGLTKELKLDSGTDAALTFNPTRVRHYAAIAEQLQLTDAEQALYQANGLVGVDHGQRYSMGSAYYAIYTRDLPVLITSDSILHALHRSYDEMLKQLELHVFSALLRDVLEAAHSELARQAPVLEGAALARSVQDLDVYLTVARKLLLGAADKTVTSRFGQDHTVKRLLADVASLRLLFPGRGAPIPLYGGTRYIDFSQFKPRGHYTQSEELQNYFRALMWLGRADTGFVLAPPAPGSGLKVQVDREQRNAALLALVLRASGGVQRLQSIADALDFLVGRSDSFTVPQMLAAIETARRVRCESPRIPEHPGAHPARAGGDPARRTADPFAGADVGPEHQHARGDAGGLPDVRTAVRAGRVLCSRNSCSTRSCSKERKSNARCPLVWT